MLLSKNFTEEEFLRSETAKLYTLRNDWELPKYKEHAIRFCKDVLQPLRDYLNLPVKITSGYRSRPVNKKVGGVWNSYHLIGLAADITVPGFTARQLYNKILKCLTDDILRHGKLLIPAGKIILEFDAWVHIQYSDSIQCLPEFMIASKVEGNITRYIGDVAFNKKIREVLLSLR